MGRGRSVRRRVLVVDDDAELRDALHLVLEDEYEVIDTADGSHALDILSTRGSDLVILHLVMSGVDSLEFLERLREAKTAIPIIVLSASNGSSPTPTAMPRGPVEPVTKPFE